MKVGNRIGLLRSGIKSAIDARFFGIDRDLDLEVALSIGGGNDKGMRDDDDGEDGESAQLLMRDGKNLCPFGSENHDQKTRWKINWYLGFWATKPRRHFTQHLSSPPLCMRSNIHQPTIARGAIWEKCDFPTDYFLVRKKQGIDKKNFWVCRKLFSIFSCKTWRVLPLFTYRANFAGLACLLLFPAIKWRQQKLENSQKHFVSFFNLN